MVGMAFPKITVMSVKLYYSAHLWHWSVGSAELEELTHAISQALSLSPAASSKHEMQPWLNFHLPPPANSTLTVLLSFGWLYWRWEYSETGIHLAPSTETQREQRAFFPQSFNSTPPHKTTRHNLPPPCNLFFFSTLCLSLPLIWEHHIFLPCICTSAVLI